MNDSSLKGEELKHLSLKKASMTILKFLFFLSLFSQVALGAQLNTSSVETPVSTGLYLQVNSSANTVGFITDQIVISDLLYLSMNLGERLKINMTSQNLFWAVKYGTVG